MMAMIKKHLSHLTIIIYIYINVEILKKTQTEDMEPLMQQVYVKRMDDSAVVANEPYPALLFSTVLLLLPGPIFQFCLFCCGTFATFSNRATYGLLLPLGILIVAFVIKCNAVAIFARDLNLRKWVKYGCIVVLALFDWALLPFL